MPTPVALAGLAMLMAGPAVAWWQGAAWPFIMGPALATGAPLLFIAENLRSSGRLAHHPIVISVFSGLGCVIVMVGGQRFGAEPEWTLYTAAASLVVWMLWQRSERRRPPSAT